MKKVLLAFILLTTILMVGQNAEATLLGIKPLLGYPDILFDNGGTITWTESLNKFYLRANDIQLIQQLGDDPIPLTVGPIPSIGFPGFKTGIELTLYFDDNGKLTEGLMRQWVVDGTVTVDGHSYHVGDTLLQGAVSRYGWGEGDLLGQFDCIIYGGDLSGEFITDGIWPDSGSTGIYMFAEILNGWDGTWDEDFNLGKVKGDKSSLVPEPSSMILLGSGLMGLAAAGFKRRKHRIT